MSTLDIHRALFVHNDWARDKLLALASGLSDEELDRAVDMGLGSLRATLGHLRGAGRVWLERCRGRPAAPGATGPAGWLTAPGRTRTSNLQIRSLPPADAQSGQRQGVTSSDEDDSALHSVLSAQNDPDLVCCP